MASTTMRALLEKKQFITAPGVFDLVSAKLANRTDCQALFITGYGVVASYLGLPDAGLATYTDMRNRVEAIAQAVDKPVIADGDTGYGGLLNVYHTVRGYEKAGAQVIQLEDQEIPKKCGHTPNRHVVPAAEMVNKIKVASDARSSRDFLILARTDAISSLGLDEALRRGEAYARAGADIILIEGTESVEEMRKIGAAFDVPLLSNQLHGGRTPILPQDQLREMGYSVAIYPTAGLFAASQALASVYDALAQHRPVEAPLYAFDDFVQMIGFQQIWDFEENYADLLTLKPPGPGPRSPKEGGTVAPKTPGAPIARSDFFSGKPMETAVFEYLEMRKAQGPAKPGEIVAALTAGGFAFDTGDDAAALLRDMLGKSAVFQKLPDGAYGLAVWYPAAKKPAGGTGIDDIAAREDGADEIEIGAGRRPS